MFRKNILSLIFTLILVSIFSIGGCGGGGGGDDDDNDSDSMEQPTPPPVSPTDDFGSIRGSVESSSGFPLNAVHVRAVNVNNPDVQISNFSGISPTLTIIDGFFQIDRIPPGDYRVLIENLDDRSSAFNPAIFSDFVEDQSPSIAFPDEYFNGNDESSDDDPLEFDVVTVTEGEVTTGVDFITNN